MFGGKEMFCKSCHTVGTTRRHMPGSIFIEILLWCCFLVPGLIYTIWRHISTKQACKACKSTEIIPMSSPLAKQLLSK